MRIGDSPARSGVAPARCMFRTPPACRAVVAHIKPNDLAGGAAVCPLQLKIRIERFVYDCATKKGAFTTAAKARFCQRVDNLFALLRLSRRTHAGRPAPKRTRASDHPCSPCPCHNRL